MMQSCASAAKLRSGGPILPVGTKAKGHAGIPPPRTVIGVPSQADGQGRNCRGSFSVLRSLWQGIERPAFRRLQPMRHRLDRRRIVRRGRRLFETLGQGRMMRLMAHRNHRFDSRFFTSLDMQNPRQRSRKSSLRQAASRKAADPRANRLLGLLSPRDYQRLRPHLQRIPLEYRQSLYRAHKPIGFVYFIETGETRQEWVLSRLRRASAVAVVSLAHQTRPHSYSRKRC